MEILKWREAYETGVEAMDSQQKRLIYPVNQMYTILRDKEGHEALDTVLAEMSDYAGQHFHDEEDLLLKHAYSGIADQQIAHHGYKKKIEELLAGKSVDKLAAAQNISAFLRQWWIGHISGDDKKYGPFLKDKGVL